MPFSNKEDRTDESDLEELREQVRSLSCEIADIHDLLLTLCTSVQYREDRPYDAVLAEYMIYGEQHTDLGLVIDAVLRRAEGVEIPQGLKRFAKQSGNPFLIDACQDAPIDQDEAIRLVQGIVDGRGPRIAIDILKAHARNGFGAEGHAKLGI